MYALHRPFIPPPPLCNSSWKFLNQNKLCNARLRLATPFQINYVTLGWNFFLLSRNYPFTLTKGFRTNIHLRSIHYASTWLPNFLNNFASFLQGTTKSWSRYFFYKRPLGSCFGLILDSRERCWSRLRVSCSAGWLFVDVLSFHFEQKNTLGSFVQKSSGCCIFLHERIAERRFFLKNRLDNQIFNVFF